MRKGRLTAVARRRLGGTATSAREAPVDFDEDYPMDDLIRDGQ
jgi:hypothetical protein